MRDQRPPPALRYAVEPGESYQSTTRDCDDPHVNFERIKNKKLWDELEQRRLKQQTETTP